MQSRVVVRSLACAVTLAAPLPWALAQPGATASQPIYSCTDADGRRLTADRQIDQCRTREQRVHNPDGSLNRIIRPTLTPEEQAGELEREADRIARQRVQQDAIRSDRNLLAKFPSELAHRKSREAALEPYRKALAVSEARIAALAVERRPLQDETEFYVGKPLPLKLRAALDANDATTEAQRSGIQNLQAELARINQTKDAELERLRYLWTGAAPGSMGTLPATASASTSSLAR